MKAIIFDAAFERIGVADDVPDDTRILLYDGNFYFRDGFYGACMSFHPAPPIAAVTKLRKGVPGKDWIASK